MHSILDLETCCDRQISELCGLVEESIGANRKVIKLLTMVLPRCEHLVGTANSASTDKCRGFFLLGRIGKGNVVSGVICIDVSYIIFRKKKTKKLGIIAISKHRGNAEQRVTIAHADDADF